MDDMGTYRSRLEHRLKRIKLKALLYQRPDNPEDEAAMIIEQVKERPKEYVTMEMFAQKKSTEEEIFLIVGGNRKHK